MDNMRKHWDHYRDTVIPSDAEEAQYQECEYAFYAGATALFFALADGVRSEEGSIQRVEALHEELHAYAASVAASNLMRTNNE